jgi:hypothetical protein
MGDAMKPWKKVLIVGIVVSALVLAPAATWLGIISVDEPPLDDSDLRVERLDIPDEQNGYWYFTRMSEVVDMPEETDEPSEEEGKPAEPPTGRALVDAILEGRAWDADFVADLWRRNEEAIRLLDEGQACEAIQAPRLRIDSEIPEVFGWLKIARLLELRAMLLLKEGKHEAALDEALRLVRLGHRIEGCKGGLVHYLVGAMVKRTGLGRLRAMVSETTLAPDVLVAYGRRLGDYRANEQGAADALRVEYEMEIQVLEDIKAGKYSLREVAGGAFGNAPYPSGSPPPPFLLHPNETKRLFVESIRLMVESVSLPYAEMKPKLDSIPDLRVTALDWRTHLKGNSVGVRLYCLLVPATGDFLAQTCQEDVELAAERTLIALKAFKVEKGRLPKTLDELVPEYLDAVPLDDYDGKPLRYSAEKKVIYSVGKDLKDGGGMTKEEQKAWWLKENPWIEEHPEEEEYNEPDLWQMPDPSFAIEF